MTLWAACLARGSLTLATDSAVNLIDGAGNSVRTSDHKLWRLEPDMWIAAAGVVRAPRPPVPWPSLPALSRGRTFEESVHGVGAQTSDLMTSPSYSLAVIRASSDGLKLAKISNDRGVELGTAPRVFLGGFAALLPPPAPDTIPTGLDRCRDLVLAIASRTLRIHGHETLSSGGPAISWPLHLFQWRMDGNMTAVVVAENEGVPAERRAFAHLVADAKNDELRSNVYQQVLLGLEANGLFPEDIIQTTIEPPKVSMTARRSIAIPENLETQNAR